MASPLLGLWMLFTGVMGGYAARAKDTPTTNNILMSLAVIGAMYAVFAHVLAVVEREAFAAVICFWVGALAGYAWAAIDPPNKK